MNNMNNELVVNDNISEMVTVGSINVDLSETRKMALQISETYSNLVYDVSEEKIKNTLKEMKADRAKLNKLMEGLDEKRKKVKKAFLVPLDAFESEIKSIQSSINDSRVIVDQKVKEVEEAAKEEKRKIITTYYNAVSGDVDSDFREELFSKIYNKSWENVSTSKKAYTDAIDAAVTAYLHGMEVLNRYDKYKEEGIKVFKMTLDLAKAQETIYLKEKEEQLIIERERARLEAEVARKEQQIRESERQQILKTLSSVDIPVQKAKTVVDKDNNVIAIRLLSGAITEVYTNLVSAGTKVYILDEDIADQKEVFDFMDKIDGLTSVDISYC